jgi:hypothetical protein
MRIEGGVLLNTFMRVPRTSASLTSNMPPGPVIVATASS